MRKKELIWLGLLLLLLCGVYARYFTSVKKPISINASWRPDMNANGALILMFTLNDDVRRTSLKFFPLEYCKFNPLSRPVWNLVADTDPAPIRAFAYGQRIRGLKPALSGVRADPLTPGASYRLVLAAGDVTGYRDFRAQAAPP